MVRVRSLGGMVRVGVRTPHILIMGINPSCLTVKFQIPYANILQFTLHQISTHWAHWIHKTHSDTLQTCRGQPHPKQLEVTWWNQAFSMCCLRAHIHLCTHWNEWIEMFGGSIVNPFTYLWEWDLITGPYKSEDTTGRRWQPWVWMRLCFPTLWFFEC